MLFSYNYFVPFVHEHAASSTHRSYEVSEMLWMAQHDKTISDELKKRMEDGILNKYDIDRITGKFYLYILKNPTQENLILLTVESYRRYPKDKS